MIYNFNKDFNNSNNKNDKMNMKQPMKQKAGQMMKKKNSNKKIKIIKSRLIIKKKSQKIYLRFFK